MISTINNMESSREGVTMDINQQESNLISFDEQQMEQQANRDKTDNTKQSSSNVFSSDALNANADEDDDDDPFTTTTEPMEIPKNFQPRVRRVSDVIDSIGDLTDVLKTGTPPDKVPVSPLSSGYGSFNYGQAAAFWATCMASPVRKTAPEEAMWSADLPSPIKKMVPTDVPAWAASLPSPDKKVAPEVPVWDVDVPLPTKKAAMQHSSDDPPSLGDKKPVPDVMDAVTNSVTDATPMEPDPCTSGESVEAIMPIHKYAEEYNMNHKRRGKAVIFNHDKFDKGCMKDREGSEVDVKCLQETYAALGFEVVVHNNLNYLELQAVINDLVLEDHSDADCLVVNVLTHGLFNNYLFSRDLPYSVETLWASFAADRCITLAGKPKIFIIQACRGDKLDPGVMLKDRRGSRTEMDSSNETSYKIPTQADFLIAYSSVEGFFSWRNPDKGTWFIQCLCQELQEKAATVDLLKVMTHVARRVALDHESFNDEIPWQHQQKQVPSFNSMLIRDIYFRPKV